MARRNGLGGRMIRFYETLYGEGRWDADLANGEHWMHLMTPPLVVTLFGFGSYWWLAG